MKIIRIIKIMKVIINNENNKIYTRLKIIKRNEKDVKMISNGIRIVVICCFLLYGRNCNRIPTESYVIE